MTKKPANAKLAIIQTLILRLAEGEYDARETVSEEQDEFDSIINSLNMLGEELKEMEEKNKQMDVFFYKVAHDMISPVRNVETLLAMGNAELRKAKYKGLAIDCFDNANKANSRLKELVLGITDLVKFNNPNLPVECIHFENLIHPIVANVKEAQNCPEFDVQIDNQLKAPFLSYPSILYFTFHNLIENACKYRKNGAVATLRIAITKVEEGVLIEFQDNGIGISDEFLKRVFGHFQRESNQIPGTGLGLYIVKNTIERVLKGRIDLISKQHDGTKVTIFLPDLFPPDQASASLDKK